MPSRDKHQVKHLSGAPFTNLFSVPCTILGWPYPIIPDILSLKTTRAFWRQNTLNFNKHAPFGAKLLGAFHWKCSTPFYS